MCTHKARISSVASSMSGTMIFTTDDRPSSSMPQTPVSLNFHKLGYDTRIGLYFGHWEYVFTVGGPFPFTTNGTRYELQQLAIIVGYQFVL